VLNLTSISSKGATIGYDGWDHATVIKPDTATAATVETLAPSGRVIRRLEPVLNLPVIDTAFGYAGEGDSPAYSGPVAANLLVLLPLTITSYISGPGGLLNIDTGGAASWPLLNGHGDVVGTTDAAGTFTANPVTDEFGVGAVPSSRLGYLGGAERFSTGASLNLIRMGVRLYDPALGRFLQVDPVDGGSANSYDYCFGDPINCWDLNGALPWRGMAKWASNAAGVSATILRLATPVCPVCGVVSLGVTGAGIALDMGIAWYECTHRGKRDCRSAYVQLGTNMVGAVVGHNLGKAVTRGTRGLSGVTKIVRGKPVNTISDMADATVGGGSTVGNMAYQFADNSTARTR
jgi:RHS repeat-associated protein